jgi:hypothetical protein
MCLNDFLYVFVDSIHGMFYAFAFACVDSRYGCVCMRSRLFVWIVDMGVFVCIRVRLCRQ